MKSFAALLVAFLMVFFLGCQENSITDPGTTEDNASAVHNYQNLTDKDLISAYPGLIKVFESVFDPTHPQNGGDQIKGVIRYNHSSLPVSATSGNPRYTIKAKFYIDLSIDAKCPLHDELMKVVARTDQSVDFADRDHNAYKEVEKVFSVCNTCCGSMNLVLRFKVDRNDVGLLSMKLDKVSRSTQIALPD